jgi:putative ABC transport system permease protein
MSTAPLAVNDGARRAGVTSARRLALLVRLVARDWRAGELRLLLAAVVVAVGTVATVSLFVDRLHSALVLESSALLAADRVISGTRPIPDAFEDAAAAAGLRRANVMSFQTMVYTGQRSQLVSVRAVSSEYPLRGMLQVADEPFGVARDVVEVPGPGEVWIDARLFPALEIAPGDRVSIGYAQFDVARVLAGEPDRSGRLFDLGPRVLMHIDDVAGTHVVQPGSRIGYRLLLAGSDAALARVHAQIEPDLDPHYRWQDIRTSTPSVGIALDRAESFLMLGALLAVLLAGVAVALSAGRYAARHYDHVAIVKTLGVTPREVQWGYLGALALVGAVGVLIGLVAGGALHFVIIEVLRDYLPAQLPLPSLQPIAIAAITGFVCLLAFGLPPVWQLRNVAPMRVIRRDLDPVGVTRMLTFGTAVGGTVVLLIWYTTSWWLTLWTLSGIAVILLLFGGLAHLLLSGGRALGMQAGNYWRLAMAGLKRRNRENLAQILIFGLAIMLLSILVLTRTALLDDWQRQLPDDAPNHFVMNVLPEQLADLQQLLEERVGGTQHLYPMVRGRILGVNGVDAQDWERERRPRDEVAAPGPGLGAERNLSWTAELPPANRVVAGRWWSADETRPLISVEAEYAGANRLDLGDVLEFDIGGIPVAAEIASLRQLDWDSMQPNFFILFSPAALGDLRATYLTSFYLPREQKVFLNELVQAFPTITVIEVDEILEQIRTIIAQVSRAVELVLLLVLGSGCLVLIASIQASRDERLREHALVRTLGGSRRLILQALTVEFAVLGLFAGIVAVVGAELTVYLLQTQIFGLEFQFHPWIWVAGPVAGAALVTAIGLMGTRKLVNSPPVAVLRELG